MTIFPEKLKEKFKVGFRVKTTIKKKTRNTFSKKSLDDVH